MFFGHLDVFRHISLYFVEKLHLVFLLLNNILPTNVIQTYFPTWCWDGPSIQKPQPQEISTPRGGLILDNRSPSKVPTLAPANPTKIIPLPEPQTPTNSSKHLMQNASRHQTFCYHHICPHLMMILQTISELVCRSEICDYPSESLKHIYY